MPDTKTTTTAETTAAPQATAQAPSATSTAKARRLKAKRTRSIIIGCVTLGALSVGGFFLFKFLTAQDPVESKLYSQVATMGSIESRVQGSGMARAKETSAITLTQNGTVEEVFVAAGDFVTVGQPLYTIFSPEAQEAVNAAQLRLDVLHDDYTALQKQLNELSVYAPFAGKLVEVTEFQTGQKIAIDTAVATLVNDKQLRLSLYFSYAYENDISVGQSVDVSIPSVMGTYKGTVDEINKVSYISPEGAVHFEVGIIFDNPGTLTADMSASAQLFTEGGAPIYAYENGTTQYAEVRNITTNAAGPLLSEHMLKYANVTPGQVLLTMGSDTIDDELRAKQTEIDTAQESLDETLKSLGNFNAVASIDGQISSLSGSLVPGGEMKSGDTAIVITNTTTMIVEIKVDDRNISFVKPNMTVELSDWNGNTFTGVVSSINTGDAEMGQGMTTYPVTLTVDNYSGALTDGAWLDYSFITSQSEHGILAPMQSVRNVSDENGDIYSVVFIKADTRPENTVTLEIAETQPGQMPQYPSEADGYYPVPVETGLSDNYNVEIKSGLTGDEEIFISYFVENSWG